MEARLLSDPPPDELESNRALLSPLLTRITLKLGGSLSIPAQEAHANRCPTP
jgi:hypothetical protein